MIHQLRAVVGRLVQRKGCIILGLDRANRNATGVAGACAAILVGLGISRRRQAPHRERGHGRRRSEKLERLGLVVGQMRERLVHVLVEKRRWDPRHRKGVAGGKCQAGETVVRYVAGNTELGFRLLVPWHQRFIADWPIRERKLVLLVHAEIVRHESRCKAHPVRCTSGKTLVGALEGKGASLLIEVGMLRLVPAGGGQHECRWPASGDGGWSTGERGGIWAFRDFGAGLVKTPHVAVDIRLNTGTGLKNNDIEPSLPIGGIDGLLTQFFGDQRSGKSGSDDRDIALNASVCHESLPQGPVGVGRRGVLSLGSRGLRDQ